MKRTAILPLLLAIPLITSGQIIRSLEHADNKPDKTAKGIIRSLDNNNTPQSEIHDWTETLKEFTETADTISSQTIINHIHATDSTKTIIHNGKKYTLPIMPDENGNDLYPLTDEGIMFYLALDKPVYMQSFHPDIIKWIRYYGITKKEWTDKTINKYRTWEPSIRECFELFGIPLEIAPLCILESGCNPNALSNAGAAGMWQIMPKTAREHKLEVNNIIDERKDPIKSMIAAAGILKSYQKQLKDWALAVAAYNCGTGRIEKSIRKKNSREWNEIKEILPDETQQYLPALIALNYIISRY